MDLERRDAETTFPYEDLVSRLTLSGNTKAALFVLNNPDTYGDKFVNEGVISPQDLKELKEIGKDEILRGLFLEKIS